MNVLFFTQSGSLRVYHDVLLALKKDSAVDKAGFYVSDHLFYQRFLAENPDFETGEFKILKEWVLAKQAKKHPLNVEKLREYGTTLDVASFWDALVCDRRLMNGPRFAFRQDYAPRCSYDYILQMLQENLIRIEKLYDEIQPDFVAGFICTTVGEFIGYLFARARNIPYLNLRATRIDNYMMYGQTVYEPSEFVDASYRGYRCSGSKDEWHSRAQEYLDFSRKKHAKYEGVFLTTQRPPQVGSPTNILKRSPVWLVKRGFKILKNQLDSLKRARNGSSTTNLLAPLVYRNFLNPLLVKRINRYLRDKYVPVESLPDIDYVFFPLAKEPEVTLLVYSKPYLNQIEVIRNVAYNLPIGKTLLVKEHPASVGTRPLKYYQKLLQIHNVSLVAPQVEPRELIKNTDLVVTIAGSVGFEALLLKKPVIIFGQTPYEMLPASMLRKVTNLNKLSQTISDLIANHRHDERALLDYIAATMKESVPIEFYTKLLGRSAQYATAALTDREEHVTRLADYTLKMAQKAREISSVPEATIQIVEEIDNGNGHHGNGRNGANGRQRKTADV